MQKGLAASALLLMAVGVNAATIDFETIALGPVSSVTAGGNTVTFSGPGGSTPTVVETGAPTEAFAPGDTPASGSFGERFITDDLPGADIGDYFFGFSTAITSLSMDSADFRADGGGAIGDIVSLQVFADVARTILLGSDSYVIDGSEVDGFRYNFSVSGVGAILGASLSTTGSDVGTGVDNIHFTSVPAPIAGLLMLVGMIGLGLQRRVSRRA